MFCDIFNITSSNSNLKVIRMVDISSLSVVVAALSVVAGVVYYSFQLRHQTRMRQTDLVMRLYSHFGNKEFQESWEKVIATKFDSYMVEVGIFFEGIGVLLSRKLIDSGLVDDLFRHSIKMSWEKVKPSIEGIRKQHNMPYAFGYFEYLYNEMQRIERRLPIFQ